MRSEMHILNYLVLHILAKLAIRTILTYMDVIDNFDLPSVKVVPEAQSTPNMATISPAPPSSTSSISFACILGTGILISLGTRISLYSLYTILTILIYTHNAHTYLP